MTVAPRAAMEDKRLRVLIAENHPDLSEVMGRIIDAEPDMRCVGRIASAHEVISTARDSSADALCSTSHFGTAAACSSSNASPGAPRPEDRGL